jgi:hypothetical protein
MTVYTGETTPLAAAAATRGSSRKFCDYGTVKPVSVQDRHPICLTLYSYNNNPEM